MSAICGRIATAFCGQTVGCPLCQAEQMIEEPVPLRLKRIREAARVGLRKMARELDLPHSSYGHYEDPNRFKEPFLPMDFAMRVAGVLERHGVDRSVILALAGAAVDASTIDARLQAISARRQQMLLDLLADLEAAEAYYREQRERERDFGEKEP